jgi:hypothetical protein
MRAWLQLFAGSYFQLDRATRETAYTRTVLTFVANDFQGRRASLCVGAALQHHSITCMPMVPKIAVYCADTTSPVAGLS